MYRYPYFAVPVFHPYHSMPYRQYPPIQPRKFMDAANHINELMVDARTIMNRISQSADFSKQIMSAAQQSNTAEVRRLIAGTRVKNIPQLYYSPDGLVLQFHHHVNQQADPCCQLQIKIRWM
ncbi:hypothetical protein [Heyndrickxia acidiproducens]|uniref:hypothetical protein n=1 Tax=Heyndrickxia acidiproducens TaxID=1121084 RepID=UPI00036BCF4F|nr:hypothetical protein [Heyndrickxia acidiproducens]